MRELCDELVRGTNDVALLLDIGALLSSYGFLTDACTCYQRAQDIAPTDLRAQIIGDRPRFNNRGQTTVYDMLSLF